MDCVAAGRGERPEFIGPGIYRVVAEHRGTDANLSAVSRGGAAGAARAINLPLQLQQDRWAMQLDDSQMQGNERLLMLCNPQNPGGTVYRRDELEAQLAFAQRHDLLVCSDEIHCDLLLTPGVQHIPLPR